MVTVLENLKSPLIMKPDFIIILDNGRYSFGLEICAQNCAYFGLINGDFK